MTPQSPGAGVAYAFACLLILGVMPIIANSRPADFDALTFAFFLSVWQVVFAVPLVVREAASADNRGIFGAQLDPALKRRTIAIIIATGGIFGLSTYLYVLALEKAGAVNASIALQAYPLFAIALEAVFLKRTKNAPELLFTMMLIGVLYALATGGTWRVEGLSPWFGVALTVPLLWSIAHIIVKEELNRTPITPAQVTFFRVLVSAAFLGVVLAAVSGPAALIGGLANLTFQAFALAMGFAYYAELIFWFYAVRSIDVSVASSIAVPAPALTMVLAILFLGEVVEPHQILALAVVAVSIYGLLFAGARKQKA